MVLKSKNVLACAKDLACSWDAVNRAVLDRGVELLIGNEHRFEGVEAISVDEHVWQHTVKGSRYVTVVVDLTPRKDGRPARLQDHSRGPQRAGVRTVTFRAAAVVPGQRCLLSNHCVRCRHWKLNTVGVWVGRCRLSGFLAVLVIS